MTLHERYAELDTILDQILARIEKVNLIMSAQDVELLTPGTEDYREKYLNTLHDDRRCVEKQIDDLLDEIDLKDIMSVALE